MSCASWMARTLLFIVASGTKLLGVSSTHDLGCFLSSCHRGCTVLANRKGWQVAGDLVPQEAPVNSSCWFFVYLYKGVVKLLLGKKNLEAGAAGAGDKWQKEPRGI